VLDQDDFRKLTSRGIKTLDATEKLEHWTDAVRTCMKLSLYEILSDWMREAYSGMDLEIGLEVIGRGGIQRTMNLW
jgi:hypothetical protein